MKPEVAFITRDGLCCYEKPNLKMQWFGTGRLLRQRRDGTVRTYRSYGKFDPEKHVMIFHEYDHTTLENNSPDP